MIAKSASEVQNEEILHCPDKRNRTVSIAIIMINKIKLLYFVVDRLGAFS